MAIEQGKPLVANKQDKTLVVDDQTKLDMDIEDRKDGGLPMRSYERWIGDLRNQPAWRALADKCADYYDNNQTTADELDELESVGMQPSVSNIVRPIIDVVLGMEAKTRQDWRVSADNEDYADVTEALSAKLSEAERESEADRACSDAYAAQIKTGLAWVETNRNPDPFGYKYRCNYIHRREIWWDWRDTSPGLDYSRFLLRKRWIDLDVLQSAFPRHAQVLEDIAYHDLTWDRYDLTTEGYSEVYLDAHQRELRTTLDELDWRDSDRQMLCLHEMWYRTWHRGPIVTIGGRVMELDTTKPEIAAAVLSGKANIRQAPYNKVRLSWWVGPHRLEDFITKKRRYPYTPFWGFREDRTSMPYGLIRPMLDPQDEYNARRRKLMWLLSSKRLNIDSDALDTDYNDISDVEREIGRPDAVVILNPNRRNQNAYNVETDHQLAAQQFTVMNDAKELIQHTAGVYQIMQGDPGQAQSGMAINSLVEQGATTLAEVNDNYRYSRRAVGQQVLDLVMEDVGGHEQEVPIGEGKRQRKVILNQRQEDGTIANDVMVADTKAALADIPSTPSYRAQQLQMLSELTKSLPEDVQGVVIDLVVEATDLANRHEVADRIRDALGVTDPDLMTEEQKAQAEEMMEEERRQKKAALQVEMRQARAEASKTEASAAKEAASAIKTKVEADIAKAGSDVDAKLGDIMSHVNVLTAAVEKIAVGLAAQA